MLRKFTYSFWLHVILVDKIIAVVSSMPKNNAYSRPLIVILITIELFAMPSFSQENDKYYHQGFSVGPGVVVSEKPYKGLDLKTHVIPFFMYESQYFYVTLHQSHQLNQDELEGI